jgi:hypothetical protein
MNPALIAEIVQILTAAVTLLPELEKIVPIVEDALNGKTPTNAELEALIEARLAVEAKVQAA